MEKVSSIRAAGPKYVQVLCIMHPAPCTPPQLNQSRSSFKLWRFEAVTDLRWPSVHWVWITQHLHPWSIIPYFLPDILSVPKTRKTSKSLGCFSENQSKWWPARKIFREVQQQGFGSGGIQAGKYKTEEKQKSRREWESEASFYSLLDK